MYRQDSPNSIQIELTEGCNLYCDFCGLQSVRERSNKNYKFLTVSLAAIIAGRISDAVSQSGWNPRIEFAMHGEPTMNPDWLEILAIFRRALPKSSLMLLSNGGGLFKGGVKENIDAALSIVNFFGIDAYEYAGLYPRIQKAYPVEIPFHPDTPGFNPHQRHHHRVHKLCFIRDISHSDKGNHAKLFNHAGCAAPMSDAGAGKKCALPFRELAIRWDGNVALCCDDWRGVYKIGNVTDYPTLDRLWQAPAFLAARKKLYHGERDFGACKGCDATSYRVGLLPDKSGKLSLDRANDIDKMIIEQAVSGATLTETMPRFYQINENAK